MSGVWSAPVCLPTCLAGGVQPLPAPSSATTQASLTRCTLMFQVGLMWAHVPPVLTRTDVTILVTLRSWPLVSVCVCLCAEESLYPPQLQEDDEVGVFVNEHKITAKLFQRFDRDPLQLQDTIVAYPQTVVAFYQPCRYTGCHGTPIVAMVTIVLHV